MIDTDNPFYGKDELTDWPVGTMSPVWHIPFSFSHLFLYLVTRMCELDPGMIDAEGRLHFKLSRLRAVAAPPF